MLDGKAKITFEHQRSACMTNFLSTFLGLLATSVISMGLLLPVARSQRPASQDSATLHGTIADPQSHPLEGAAVSLENDMGKTLDKVTDSQGHYSFAGISPGTYTLRVKRKGWRDTNKGPLALGPGQEIIVDLRLRPDEAPESNKSAAPPMEFSIEPTFTVAGVTDPTNLGGHGSDVGLRTKDSLAKATVSLNSADIGEEKRRVAVLHNGPDTGELHELLGDIAESEGRSLEAEREYERAAKMEPTEANLFAWGAELLLHRALEPASEVFTKGHKLFPRSTRMLLGLGVTSYGRGRTQEAAEQLAAACDLDPADPTPYLFLGKIQSAEKIEPPGWTERLKRFASLHPENALAHYYYAVALTKDAQSTESPALVESSLLTAIKLDPQCGDAYLQLGILYADRKDLLKAIAAYQKAIEAAPSSAESHFRLAAAYRSTGDAAKAREEMELYEQISKQTTEQSERERHEIQQFVYTLRGQAAPSRGADSHNQ
jgi:tetratricopeptide (TPR) repeat protein